MYYIYTITNTSTQDVYIGQTCWLDKRISKHRCTLRVGKHCNRFLQRSFNKYGAECFKYDVIEKIDGVDLANQREAALIAEYKATGHRVYNLRAGGKNQKLTEDHKRRISEALKGRKKSAEARRKMSEAKIGSKQSPESIAKRLVSVAWYKPTEEHRRKLSVAAKKRWAKTKGDCDVAD